MLRNHGVKVSVIVAAFGIGVWVGAVRTDAQRTARVLEVRRYTANAGKLDALLQRMREGETKLFEKHGMKGIFYSVAADAPESQNTFIYVRMRAGRQRRNRGMTSADPAWKSMRDTSEAGGPLVGKVESTFVTPTDFSPLK